MKRKLNSHLPAPSDGAPSHPVLLASLTIRQIAPAPMATAFAAGHASMV